MSADRAYLGCCGDACDAAALDGVVCADNACDIRAGVRPAPCDHPLKQAFDEMQMRERFGLAFDEIFGSEG